MTPQIYPPIADYALLAEESMSMIAPETAIRVVSCPVIRTAVICRHCRDHGFKLGLRRGHRLF